MNKIRLTESQLHRVIKEAVNKVILSEGMLDAAPMAGEMPRGNEQKVQQAISLAQEGLAQLQSLGAVNPQSAPWLQDARRELKNLSFRAKSQGNYNQQSFQMGDYQQ